MTTKNTTAELTAQLTEQSAVIEQMQAQIDALLSKQSAVKTRAPRQVDPAKKAFTPLVRDNAAVALQIVHDATERPLSRERDLDRRLSLKARIAYQLRAAGLLLRVQSDRAETPEYKAKKKGDATYTINPDCDPALINLLASLVK